MLVHQIESGLYQRQVLAEKVSNFESRLPSPQSELAAQTMKDPYIFDFIPFKEDMVERDIEQALVKDVTKLLLELGTGFAFLGNQYHLNVCENADGSLLKAGEWIFTGDDIVQLSQKDNCSVLFTVSAHDADDTLLGEGTFLYDVAQEKLYVTISEDGVTCSTSDAADAPADVPPVLTLPILDEIDQNVTIGTAGSSLLAVQEAAKLLDWGENTGLGADEVSDAASTWLAARNNDLTGCLKKLELVDGAYRKLLTGEARELLDSAGCEDVEITWGSDPVEPVEAIMQAAGLRG